MKIIYNILVIITLSFSPEQELQYKNGKPTSNGIDNYVKTNENQFIKEFQQYVNDSLYNDIFITTEDLSKRTDYDSLELGRTEIHNNYSYEIIITNETKFSDYEINSLTPKGRKKKFNEYDQFVKATVFHELMHIYIIQQMLIVNMKGKLNTYYCYVQLYPNAEMKFGADFIQEGICEYIIRNKKEIIQYNNEYFPDTKDDLLNKKNVFNVKYKYSSQFLKDFLDITTKQYGNIKIGIEMLLENNPPTYQEILNPNLFFYRLR